MVIWSRPLKVRLRASEEASRQTRSRRPHRYIPSAGAVQLALPHAKAKPAASTPSPCDEVLLQNRLEPVCEASHSPTRVITVLQPRARGR